MATPTLSEIEVDILLELSAFKGTPAYGNPYALRRDIFAETDNIAEKTDTYYRGFYADLSGTEETPQVRLCHPRLYRIVGVTITLSDGEKRTLLERTPTRMFRMFPEWRTDPEVGDPEYFIPTGKDVEVYPHIDYTLASGVEIEGYGTPGSNWVAGVDPADTDPYPLPEWTLDAVTWSVCCRIARRHILVPGMREQLELFYKERDDAIGRLGRQVARQRSQGTRRSVPLLTKRP